VNQRYRDRVPAATEQIGEKLAMSTQSMVDAHTFFTRAMARIQTEAANKFFLANVSPTIVVGGR
jgi:hypothetical protein